MCTLGPDGEIASATADFQDTVVVGKFGLPNEPFMDAVEAEQAGQQIVAGKQRVVASGREVVMWMMFRHRIYGRPLANRRIG